ncbi:MAG: DNA polymerase IV [Tissierellia bacterium]|nr:DNA polymerase IV [Tissierellia bacterium]
MGRVVFLVDMNAFYISCESTRHPEIIGKPAAVAGDPINRTGIILTANYEARKYGVKTTMILKDAFKLCPDLTIIPPDHKFYESKSREVMKILSDFTPIIEQNSIDEAWLDMTGSEKVLGLPMVSAKKIMDRINKELGLWCSIGISENKFLSKIASEMKKPMGITELWKKDIKEKMWPLSVMRMYGVGKQTAKKLHDMGIISIKDLATAEKKYIIDKLGKIGSELYYYANGIDTSPVTLNSGNNMKSIGRSVTLPNDTVDIECAKKILLELSDDVGMTARKHGKKGNKVQISIKYSNFKSVTRQTTVKPTYLVKNIYLAGIKLLEENWNNQPIRLLGISISGFNNNYKSDQLSLFELPKINEQVDDIDKIDNLESAIYNIREKYGSSIIKHGPLIKKM